MKKSIFLLIAIFGILTSQAFAETTADDSKTDAGSIDQETCLNGVCPAPAYQKPATLASEWDSLHTVKSVMGEADAKPPTPETQDSKTHK
jgi:hypothetical protein